MLIDLYSLRSVCTRNSHCWGLPDMRARSALETNSPNRNHCSHKNWGVFYSETDRLHNLVDALLIDTIAESTYARLPVPRSASMVPATPGYIYCNQVLAGGNAGKKKAV